jgi:hypothetical protein
MKQIHNIQKSIGKSIPPLWIFKIPRKKCAKQKSIDFCQTFVIYTQKSIG